MTGDTDGPRITAVPLPVITCIVHLDLRGLDDRAQRSRIYSLRHLARGAAAEILVDDDCPGEHSYALYELALVAVDRELRIYFLGDVHVIGCWVDCTRKLVAQRLTR